jgi:hypothetical protein
LPRLFRHQTHKSIEHVLVVSFSEGVIKLEFLPSKRRVDSNSKGKLKTRLVRITRLGAAFITLKVLPNL